MLFCTCFMCVCVCITTVQYSMFGTSKFELHSLLDLYKAQIERLFQYMSSHQLNWHNAKIKLWQKKEE